MTSSSSELSLSETVSIMFTLPKELDTPIRSALGIVDHSEPELTFIESVPLIKCRPFFLLGMFIARPELVGDASGDDCSARVL
jgi:hypothetical protein